MLNVSSSSIPGRIYAYWVSLTGGNRWSYRENLCHFVRVVLFWTWWHAFWRQRILRTFVRPWMVLAAGIYIAVAIKAPVVLAYSLAIPIAVAVILLIIWILEKSSQLLNDSKAWRWFWGKKFLPLVYPWTITLALGQIAAYLLNRDVFFIISAVEVFIAIILLGIVLVALMVAAISFIGDLFGKTGVSKSGKKFAGGVASSTRIAFEYVKAKKRGICPYINIV